jgi:outer membrane protein assembly factor BamA
MVMYLNKVGYFNSGVAHVEIPKRNKKVHSDYLVTPSIPYRLKEVTYAIDDTLIAGFISGSKTEQHLLAGDIFNAFKLDDERDRITEILQNNGYYYFNRDFIYFEVDSAMGTRQMNVTVKIRPNRVNSPDNPLEVISRPHLRYFINNIYIKPAFDPTKPAGLEFDTLKYSVRPGKSSVRFNDYYILHQGEIKVRPSTISQSVFIKPGDPYRTTDVKKTRARINELGLFSYNNIRFKEVIAPDTAGFGLLDCNIDLSRRKLHSFTVETEATNSGGRPGIGLNFTYQNSNIFGGAEILRLKARIALEAQKIFGGDDEYSESTPFFNTIETGFQVAVDFPRFLIPIRQERFPKYFRPKTTVSVAFGYEDRPEYVRWVTNFLFGYDWKESDLKRHQVFPFDWSLTNVTLSPDFQEQIDNEPNDRIKNQYTDNLIMGPRYSFTYNTQDIRKIQNFFYFRGNIQTAGNLLQLGYTLTDPPKDSLGNYQVWGIAYAQFFKIDGDFRLFNVIARNTSLAYRFFLGIGVPYGNSSVLPLETGFYAGGANDMRGWPYRLLGPGAYSNPEDNYDKMGDLQLEANIEYRFPIYNFIKSAIFADIGNIWILEESDAYPGGDFKFDRFYKEFAIDVGLGLRLDFNFFILRVDAAIPLRNPAQPRDARWVMDDWQFKDIIVNFGIGYPF